MSTPVGLVGRVAVEGGKKDGSQSGETGCYDGGAGFDGAPDDPVDDRLREIVAARLVFALEFDHVV